jgi:hypothetical protein
MLRKKAIAMIMPVQPFRTSATYEMGLNVCVIHGRCYLLNKYIVASTQSMTQCGKTNPKK